MVAITELPNAQMGSYFPSGGTDLSEYTQAIQRLQPGALAQVPLSGLTERALKRRMTMAAKQVGLTIKWAPQHPANMLVFMVVGGTTARGARNGTVRGGTAPARRRTARTAVEKQAASIANATHPATRRGRKPRALARA